MSDALIVLLTVFLLLVFFGMPVAWATIASTMVWMGMTDRWHLLPLIPERIYQGLDVFVLLSLPLFILAGELINEGKITDRLVHFSNILVGWMRGGLSQVNVVASMLFAGITGTALGDIASQGKVFIPAMVQQGYTPAYAAAVTACTAIIGPMVPPSLVIVLYGSMTNLSIGALFLACIIPGILLGVVQMILVAIQSWAYDFPRVEMDRSPKEIVKSALHATPPMMIPVIILCGLVFGIMTPTEAGAAAAFYALLLSVFGYRSLKFGDLPDIFGRSMIFTGQIMIVVACGATFSWAIGMENLPELIVRGLKDYEFTQTQTLIVFNILVAILGMFIDTPTTTVLFAPILSEAAESVGIDPIHFGVVMILNLNIGLITPPLGICLFAVEKIANCGYWPIVSASMPFIGASVVGLILVTYFPQLSLWLPRLAGF